MVVAQQQPIGAVGAIALMIGIGLVIFISGTAVVAIARRAADGRLKPNGLAGIRTRATRASPQAWEAAHQAGYKPSVQGGQVMQITAVLAPAVGLVLARSDSDRVVLIWAVVLGVGVTISLALVIYGAVLGDRAAKAVNQRAT